MKNAIPYLPVTVLACLVFAAIIINDLYKADINRDHSVYLYSDNFCTPDDYQEDTKGLQKLIDCAAISGKTALITKGSYLVDSLVVKGGKVRIDGADESYLYKVGHSQSVFYMQGPCELRGLTVYGNESGSAFFFE